MEFKITQKDLNIQYKVGEKYSHFQDPDTGKWYRPKDGFEIVAMEGRDLAERFIEIE